MVIDRGAYQKGDLVVLLELQPDDGYSICIVDQVLISVEEVRYDLIIMSSTHYGPDCIGDVYRGVPEHRLGRYDGVSMNFL